MNRSFKFLLRPTVAQTRALEQMLESHRLLYNAALEERREAWRQGYGVGWAAQASQLRHIRAADPDIGRWNADSQHMTVRRLDRAYEGFFRRVQAHQTPGFPRFKSKARWDSVVFSHIRSSWWDRDAKRLSVQGVGRIQVHLSREIEGRWRQLIIKREGNRWFAIFVCDQVPTKPLPVVGRSTGIDLGVANFVATSAGDFIPNPRHFANGRDLLTRRQRALARKKRGSHRRRKQRVLVAKAHQKIRRQRRDYHVKVARGLVAGNDIIVHEKLLIANMTRSAKGTIENPGRNVAAKSGLNRSIIDAGWGQFIECLRVKAEEAERTVIAVDPHHTSQTCAECGHVDAENRGTQDKFRCRLRACRSCRYQRGSEHSQGGARPSRGW